VHLLLYLLVPLAINLICVLKMPELFPLGSTLVLRGGGMLLAVSWGWAGVFTCVLAGVLFGLPIAGLQAAYLRSRLVRIQRGADVRAALRPDPWLAGPWPWLVAALVAFGVGWFWVFPPLGGPLMSVNVLWARTLLYHPELLAYEYRRADQELRREQEPADPDLIQLPHSV
jgi:hypothetical protein